MKNTNRPSSPKLFLQMLKSSFIYNPVLTQIIGICPVVAAATTTKNAAIISLVMFAVLAVCEVLASAVLKKLEQSIRVCLYCLVSTVVTVFAMSLTDDKTLSSLGIFLPLLSVNAMVTVRCEKFAVRTGVRNSVLDAIASSLCFGAVAVVVGFLRELLAFGTIFSLKVSSLPTFSAFALPFGGLVLLGFLAAIHKAFVKRRFVNEMTDTFNFSKIYEKPTLRDPGLGKKKSKPRPFDSDDTSGDLSVIRPRHLDEEKEKDGEGNE